MKCNYFPIIVFIFNRPHHTKKMFQSLSENPEIQDSPLYIFCDGPRDHLDLVDVSAARDVAREFKHHNKVIYEADKNIGLSSSVMQGISRVISKYKAAIVLEDDLVVHKDFLRYMNEMISKYWDNSEVMQVSGYMFPITQFKHNKSNFLLNNISSWGWATWERAWIKFNPESPGWSRLLTSKILRKMFNVNNSYDYSDLMIQQKLGKINSWAIRWYWSVFSNNGLVVYPPISYVKNIGFDGTGTHCGYNEFSNHLEPIYPVDIFCNTDAAPPNQLEKRLIESQLMSLGGNFFRRLLRSILSFIRREYIKRTNYACR